jgi:hypothetical protein
MLSYSHASKCTSTYDNDDDDVIQRFCRIITTLYFENNCLTGDEDEDGHAFTHFDVYVLCFDEEESSVMMSQFVR